MDAVRNIKGRDEKWTASEGPRAGLQNYCPHPPASRGIN